MAKVSIDKEKLIIHMNLKLRKKIRNHAKKHGYSSTIMQYERGVRDGIKWLKEYLDEQDSISHETKVLIINGIKFIE